ncbi:MAG: biotin--[acetyl-CoA-carboxylase] ligase, partial [Sphingomonadaceae bacterium]|nr:biotin--[acetyl-CoA-carboxylase] ligase [Sphingomonadaceae bacterium]
MRYVHRVRLPLDPCDRRTRRRRGAGAALTIVRVAETQSTNADMLARAAQGATEGEWLVADTQTDGCGRMGRAWESPPGNLYASGLMRLHPDDPPAATLALVAGVAVHQALALWADGMTLKWPNDALAGEAKIAGVLLERAGDAVVVGVGANLARHPDLPDRHATSLAALGIATPEPIAVAEALT